jgi:serine protease Do
VVDQLKAGGKIRRGWLGVRIQQVTEEISKSLNLPGNHGALVSSLTADSPAAKGGVKAGDVILSFDGKPVTEMRRLPRIVAEAPINKKTPMVVWRDGKEVTLSVTVGEMKEEDKADSDINDDEDGGKAPTAKSTKSTTIPEFDVKIAVITPELRKGFEIGEAVKGLVITSIGDNSTFSDKGLKPGDVIAEAAQKEMKDPKDFAALAKEAAANKRPLLMLIDRAGDLRFVAVNPIEKK